MSTCKPVCAPVPSLISHHFSCQAPGTLTYLTFLDQPSWPLVPPSTHYSVIIPCPHPSFCIGNWWCLSKSKVDATSCTAFPDLGVSPLPVLLTCFLYPHLCDRTRYCSWLSLRQIFFGGETGEAEDRRGLIIKGILLIKYK